MSGPEPYDPGAGHHPAPDQQYNPADYAAPAGGAAQGGGPQHSAYDPQTGLPIPPGYVPPHRPPPSSEYFPPPPRQEFNEDHWDEPPPRSDYDRGGYDRAPRSDYSYGRDGYGRDGYDERPYAPSDPHGHEGNMMTPYDEEKAEAEDRRAWEQEQRDRQRYGQGLPPPPSDEELRRNRYYDERDRKGDDRYYDYRRDDRDRYTDDSYESRDRRYEKDPRRRDSRNSPTKTGKDIFGGREGQRGISAQILGGAAGGLAGHELGGSLLETLGGVVVGAFGAKVLENQYEKRKTKKEDAMKNAAPFKDDAIRDRRGSQASRPVRDDRRDDRRDYPRDRSRSRTRSRGAPRRRESDDYSDDYSPPPPRR